MKSLKEYQVDPDAAPHWARGCEACAFGLVVAPDIIGKLSMPEQRAVQMDEGLIEFCGCHAGKQYEKHLHEVLAGLSMESRRNIRTYFQEAPMPTMHYEGVIA